MSLTNFLKKGYLGGVAASVATATVATFATDMSRSKRTVAGVAGVAVANAQLTAANDPAELANHQSSVLIDDREVRNNPDFPTTLHNKFQRRLSSCSPSNLPTTVAAEAVCQSMPEPSLPAHMKGWRVSGLGGCSPETIAYFYAASCALDALQSDGLLGATE